MWWVLWFYKKCMDFTIDFGTFVSINISKRIAKGETILKVSIVGFENDVKNLVEYLKGVGDYAEVVALQPIENSAFWQGTVVIHKNPMERFIQLSRRWGYYNLSGNLGVSYSMFLTVGGLPDYLTRQDLQELPTSLIEQINSLPIVYTGSFSQTIQSEHTTTTAEMEIREKTTFTPCLTESIKYQAISQTTSRQTARIPPNRCQPRIIEIRITNALTNLETYIKALLNRACKVAFIYRIETTYVHYQDYAY